MAENKIRTDSPLARAPAILRPFQEFARLEASGGILLLACTVMALAWANSPWGESYQRLWEFPLSVGAGDFVLQKSLLWWINDGLMAIFFFVVGLEIKREVLVGELASPARAALPIAGALGGVLFPAAIYTLLNFGTPAVRGWGVPMATDIAFVIGVMTVLGNRVPWGLRVFLTALAIVDDLMAVLVIALFYTDDLSWISLLWGAGLLAALFAANRAGVRNPRVYAILGVGLWFAFLKSGVHPTVAGVLLAATIPSSPRLHPGEFLAESRSILGEFEKAGSVEEPLHANEDRLSAVRALESACEAVETPLQRLEHGLHPWVTYFIMPVFALANAGVVLEGSLVQALGNSVTIGVILGLVMGKPLGITLLSWLAVRARLAELPTGVGWYRLHAAGWLGGIGFTMALFIAGLAFGEGELLTDAKIGVLASSLLAAAVGAALLASCKKVAPAAEPAGSTAG
jgi:NhaA family Na+:H+ antiporter